MVCLWFGFLVGRYWLPLLVAGRFPIACKITHFRSILFAWMVGMGKERFFSWVVGWLLANIFSNAVGGFGLEKQCNRELGVQF